jgi:hypothetical protein
MSNNQGTNELAIGIMIFVAIAIALAVAGVIIALLAVAGFVFNEWRKIYRYEGKQPVLWLAGITTVLTIPCIHGALEQFGLFVFYLERQNQGGQVLRHALGAIAFIVGIAAPTAAYWFYRLVKPISHIRVNIVEMFHEQYRRGEITRKQRDASLATFIAKTDDELEEMVVNERRNNQQAAHTAPQQPASGTFDVPEQH